MTLTVSAPVAEETPSRLAIWSILLVDIACWPGFVMTRSRENLWPCSSRSPGFMPKRSGPPLPCAGLRVTVMSVPTP